jgi:hypothetical protein
LKRSRNGWDNWVYPQTKDVDTTFCTAVCAELSKEGPVAEYLASLVFQGKLREVVEHPVLHYVGLRDFRASTQIQALFKKNPDVDLGYDPLRTAWKAFIDAELHCRKMNEDYGTSMPPPIISQVLSLARERIQRVLGPVPPLKRLRPRFGPGASTTIKKADACFENKLISPLVCSEEMFPVVNTFLEETPGWTRQHSESCSASRYAQDDDYQVLDWVARNVPIVIDVGTLSFVEKNAKTDRPIVVEPVLNGFWQLGVGDYLKERLRIHAGQDLRDQQRNQDLAKRGSLDGSVATIDLSSASDTVAFSVVFDLLPEPWVDLLSQLRTGRIEYDGCQVELEKFSSMGNGYTFELETLIFWAIASSCTEIRSADQSLVSVYGDDIIVPTDVVEILYLALSYCGFFVNHEKSFDKGPFRESCGADWLNGDDVRPIFKKDRVSYQWLYTFHNWSMRRGEIKLASIASSFIPKEFQLYGPDGFGDGHLLGSYELTSNRFHKRRGYGGGYFNTLIETPRTTRISGEGEHLYGLYDLYSRGPTDWWEPRGSRQPGTAPGSTCVKRTSIYTFSETIFSR